MSEQNFEQNNGFLRALPAGRISHFSSRSYPSLFESLITLFIEFVSSRFQENHIICESMYTPRTVNFESVGKIRAEDVRMKSRSSTEAERSVCILI